MVSLMQSYEGKFKSNFTSLNQLNPQNFPSLTQTNVYSKNAVTRLNTNYCGTVALK
jgi:hypothetical protein